MAFFLLFWVRFLNLIKLYPFLWERHLAAMIVAGAYSAEVAADSAIAAPAATAGLATKAGSHSHKGDTSLTE
jgi:hypothetical protein